MLGNITNFYIYLSIILIIAIITILIFKNKSNSKLKSKGIKVNKSYYEWKSIKITHGLFEFENTDSESISFAIEDVKCITSTDKTKIDKFIVYKLPEFEEIQSTSLRIDPNTKFQLEISFPAIIPPKGVLEEIYIEIRITSKSFSKVCRSPYIIIVRKKK